MRDEGLSIGARRAQSACSTNAAQSSRSVLPERASAATRAKEVFERAGAPGAALGAELQFSPRERKPPEVAQLAEEMGADELVKRLTDIYNLRDAQEP